MSVEHHTGSSGGVFMSEVGVLIASVDAVASILSMLRKDLFIQRIRDHNY